MIRIPKLLPARVFASVLLLFCLLPVRAYDWLPPTKKVTLLAVWAHPDDEGIFGGGSLPYYARRLLQVPTMLLCLTDGYMDPGNLSRDDELRCAAWNYGVRYEPIFGHFLAVESKPRPTIRTLIRST